MKSKLHLLFFGLAACILLHGCAPSYRVINPSALKYQNLTRSNENYTLDVSVDRHVLANSGNTRYDKRANKKNFGVFMVKVTNNSSTAVAINQGDIVLIDAKDNPLRTVSGSYVKQQIKGSNGLYFLWSLLWLTITSSSSSSGPGSSSSSTSVVPIPIGFFIGLGNFIGAQQAAKNLEGGLSSKESYPLTIEPGKSSYFGLYIQDPAANSMALQLVVKQNNTVLGKAEF